MLYAPSSAYHVRVDNFGTNPAALMGTSVIPGASDAEGSWTQVLSALAGNVYGLYVRVGDGSTTGQQKDHLLDLGTDPAGGSSYTARISNIVCGASSKHDVGQCGHQFFFPLFIPAGATVAARIQGNNATAGTVRVMVKTYMAPSAPWLIPVGQYSETLGTITNSQGVSFTPGNASEGTLVSLGTTARDMWWWQLAYQVSNSTITTEKTYIRLYYGPSGSQTVIHELMHVGVATEAINTVSFSNLVWHASYVPLKAGTELWVNGRCIDAPDTGYNAVAIGIGG